MHGKLTKPTGTSEIDVTATFEVYRTNPVPTRMQNTFIPIVMYQKMDGEKVLPGVMIFNNGTDVAPSFQICELRSFKEKNGGMETSSDLDFLLRQYFRQDTDEDFNNRKVEEVKKILQKVQPPEE